MSSQILPEIMFLITLYDFWFIMDAHVSMIYENLNARINSHNDNFQSIIVFQPFKSSLFKD